MNIQVLVQVKVPYFLPRISSLVIHSFKSKKAVLFSPQITRITGKKKHTGLFFSAEKFIGHSFKIRWGAWFSIYFTWLLFYNLEIYYEIKIISNEKNHQHRKFKPVSPKFEFYSSIELSWLVPSVKLCETWRNRSKIKTKRPIRTSVFG